MKAISPTLRIEKAVRRYRLPRARLLGRAPMLTAVDGVSLEIGRGESLGIVGESGSGKSTLARLAMAFEPPDEGRVLFEGKDLNMLPRQELRRLRRKFQMIFQDPFGSLDPRRTVGWSVAEPLLEQSGTDRSELSRRVAEALQQVGLRASDAGRYPHEFSGGQRQRIAIARAIVTRPALLVADEPVSSLDVSIQAQILNLLMELQEEMGLSLMLISHDLAVIASLCDRTIVMNNGKVVEQGPTAAVLSAPRQDYTRSLVAAAGHQPL